MAKKYLLYIHSERFNDEEKKSGLVNQLLADHYDEQDRPKKLPARTGIAKLPPGALDKLKVGKGEVVRGVDAISSPVPGADVPGKAVVQPKPIKTAADAKKAVVASKSGEVAFCEHGFAPGFCKHSKCKNAKRA